MWNASGLQFCCLPVRVSSQLVSLPYLASYLFSIATFDLECGHVRPKPCCAVLVQRCRCYSAYLSAMLVMLAAAAKLDLLGIIATHKEFCP